MSLTLSRSEQQTTQCISNQQSTSTVTNPLALSQTVQPLSRNYGETSTITSSFLATTSSAATSSADLVHQVKSRNQISAIQQMVAPPLFAGSNVQTVSSCSFQVYQGPVTIVQETKPPKRRRITIESDEDE